MCETQAPKLRVRSWGQGLPLLLIHGCASDSAFFEESAALLADAYRAIVYDRRGYGDSSRPEDGDYSVKSQAADALRVLHMSQVDQPAWLVAHSGGATVAMELALSSPEAVRGMILVEPAVTYREELLQRINDWFADLQRYHEQNKLSQAMLSFVKMTGMKGEHRKTGELNDMFRSFQNMQNFLAGELAEVFFYTPEEERIRALSMPVAVVASEQGGEMTFGETARQLAQEFGWPLYRMPGYHNAPQVYPHEFAALVREVIEKASH